jgi:hypothetical protein
MNFLRKEWIDAANEAAQNSDLLKTAAANITLGLQQVVTDVPGGGEDIHHFFRADHGEVEIGLGDLPEPNATMTGSYEAASAMHRGELDPMAAFSTGKVLVTGDMMVLMQHQGLMTQMNTIFDNLRDQTEYEA